MSKFVVLIVENDLLQREMLADLFRDRGYEVIACSTAESAELVVATAGNELLALVSDISLDGKMTGVELAEYARERFPHIKLVILSGRSPSCIPQGARFFLKPCRGDELLEAVAG